MWPQFKSTRISTFCVVTKMAIHTKSKRRLQLIILHHQAPRNASHLPKNAVSASGTGMQHCTKPVNLSISWKCETKVRTLPNSYLKCFAKILPTKCRNNFVPAVLCRLYLIFFFYSTYYIFSSNKLF